MRSKKLPRYFTVLAILGAFILLSVALIGQNKRLEDTQEKKVLEILDNASFASEDKNTNAYGDGGKSECLYLWDSGDDNSVVLHEQMPRILKDMKVSFVEADISREQIPTCSGFDKVIMGFTQYSSVKEQVTGILDWVSEGGSLLMAQVPQLDATAQWVLQRMGIDASGHSYYRTPGIRIKDDFMLHGSTEDYKIDNSFESSLVVALGEESIVHMVSCDDKEIPLLWESSVGEGKAVTVNVGIYEKSFRGIYAAAYSLMGDCCVYPVINGAAFYLDGYPCPLPQGNSPYITKVYGKMDLHTFYINEWWPDLSELSEKYGIAYTGTIMENRDNQTEPPFQVMGVRNRYQQLGSMLIEGGGEIGILGYNAQPLCVQGFFDGMKEENSDYEKDLFLRYWKNKQDMRDSLTEINTFAKSLFPRLKFAVYTPPSNILSEDGRTAVRDTLTDVTSLAGSYFGSSYVQEQEFGVAGDGLIETPRITSGVNINNEMKLSSLSELNMHYVNSHYMYPSDALNPGTDEAGWPSLLEQLDKYMEWLEASAPYIRRLTGSEMAGAVQRFHYVQCSYRSMDEGVEIDLDNFQDEAWFIVRLNKWKPQAEEVEAEGGELVHLQGSLYLLKASENHVEIGKKAAE
ncbi:MAG: DUF2194 domain-containing protein [Eubacteriales bacterium]|nr:DUF2194 domain-containing protein [Eubacteriales bacterium]